MKKIVLPLLMTAVLCGTSFAGFGVAIKAGAGQTDSDVETVRDMMTSYSYTDSTPGIFGLELFYERNSLFNLSENYYFGAKIGYVARGSEELEGTLLGSPFSDEIDYAEVPVTIYYKYSPDQKLGLIVGAGAAFGKAKAKIIHKSKTYPFLTAGVEYKFTPYFALGLDAKYNMGAKFAVEDFVLRKINGLEGLVSAKFFF